MKLIRLSIAGFGRLSGRTLSFGEGLTVVYGPNEAGKSTLAAAIVASLYGVGRRKDAWRPWNGGPYATTLAYELADGRAFEVQRDYARDAKGVHVYDRDGNDVAANVSFGKNVAPGEVHLQIPLEAFVNASCVLQQAVEIDSTRQTTIATALARALDGGPKEDAALGAIKRLEDARKALIGTPKATVNNPLRAVRDELGAREREAQHARNARDVLAQLRERRGAAFEERDRIAERRAAALRDGAGFRAAELRSRLDDLRVYREDLAAQQAERASYDDVADFAADRVLELDAAFYAWQQADGAANVADAAAAEAQPTPADRGERAAREADAGALDDLEFSALRLAAEAAESARATASAAASEAAAARNEGSGGRSINGVALIVAATFGVLTIGMAIAHWWSFTEIFAGVAAVAFAIVALRSRERLRNRRVAVHKQRIADESLAAERESASTVAAVLDRLGVTNVEELTRRRDRLAELRRSAELAERALARAHELRASEAAAAAAFDRLADEIVPDTTGSRRGRREIATGRAARRRERDGVDNGIAMLAMRRNEILRGDDEFALIAERDELAAAGIVPADAAGREVTAAKIAELDRLLHEADLTVARLTTELDLGESSAAELAPIEESVERLRGEVVRLESLERVFKLAIATLERLTHEAHQAFARRLETYATEGLREITGGRYSDLRVDASSLIVRVRVPETGAIEDLDVLSAGTRDQIYLIVRFAMARMFAEGLELPPLLLDDPFAYWDAERIGRCLPLIARNAFGAQTILFTASADLADVAERLGVTRINLDQAEAVLA